MKSAFRITIAFLAVVFVTMLSACSSNVDPTVAQTADYASTSDDRIHPTEEQDSSFHRESSYVATPSLEKVLLDSDVVVRARCIEKITEEVSKGFLFEVTENYIGADELSQIFVRGSNPYAALDDLKYETGKEYYLLLYDGRLPYTQREEYILENDTLFLPVDDIASWRYMDDPLMEHSELANISTKEEFEDYIRAKLNESGSKPDRKNSRIYLSNTAQENVITNSPSILRINIGEEQSRSAPDRAKHYCTVTECIRGEIETGTTVEIIFARDTVKEGDDVVVAVYEGDPSEPRYFVLTSRASVFTPDKYDEIKAIVDENNPS